MNNLNILFITHKSDDIQKAKECFNSFKLINIPHDITVINNRNIELNEFFIEIMKENKLRHYIYLNNETPYPELFNLGVSLLNDGLILLIHPDSKLINSWVDNVVTFMLENKKVGIVDSVGFSSIINQRLISPFEIDNNCEDDFKPMIWGEGFCYIFRKDIYDTIRLNGSSIYSWFEKDLAFMSLKRGYINYATNHNNKNLMVCHYAKNPNNFDETTLRYWKKSNLKEHVELAKKYADFKLLL